MSQGHSGVYDLVSNQKNKGSTYVPRAINTSVKKRTHVKPLAELPPFPLDLVQMKNRNRKLLASLNQKKRFKDFEYKNYDSTDSDLYEEEDYMKIKKEDVDAEQDFLRQRRLQRRLDVKHEIMERLKLEKAALAKRMGHRPSISVQPTKHPAAPKRQLGHAH